MAKARERTAACACGQLAVRLVGEPKMVSSCCCQQCQRRTGSFFGVTAFFGDDQLASSEGDARIFERTAESGNRLAFRFCPRCGSTVWWRTEARPGDVCIAGGSFADADFPAPRRMIWTEHRHPWVRVPDDLPLFDQGPRPPPLDDPTSRR